MYRKHLAIIFTAILLLVDYKSLGQSNAIPQRDSYMPIGLLEFNRLVDRSIKLLQTKSLSAISDTDHINIMRCLNTIFMVHKEVSIEERFSGGRYTELENTERKVNYEKDIVKVYTKWIPNRGMGYYFPLLKMELYGTPMPYAIFKVSE
jgi:hypothetical protein